MNSPPWHELALSARRVTIVLSDATRDEPRGNILDALYADGVLDQMRVTLAIATGTHGPTSLEELGIDNYLPRVVEVVNHDGHDPSNLVHIGNSTRGTAFRIHRCAVDCDLLVLTGWIKPHYFAGFGAGSKALFPGLGSNDDIRYNHKLKSEPRARAGVVDGNPCREDLEECLDHLSQPVFLCNLVGDSSGSVCDGVAGEPRAAFRHGASLASAAFRIQVPRSDLVVVSDDGAVNRSLYQASKMVAAVADVAKPGGRIVVAAECRDGTGPIDVVNRAIYDIGLRPRLAQDVEIILVSDLPPNVVEPTYCQFARSVDEVVGNSPGVFIPYASTALIDVVGEV